jgi:hypothetical protein
MSPERSQPGNSRADQLRQKRQQSSQERVNTARQQFTKTAGPAANPTPLRRTSPYATPSTGAYRPAAARKVYYAPAGNGVEIRMPSLPMIQMNWQMGAAAIAIVVLVLVLLLANLDVFQAKVVDVTGVKRVTAADIQAVVDNNNRSIFTLDRQKTIDAIEVAFPELTHISLRVVFPNKVVLNVQERQPIMAWASGEDTQWISADGVIMPVRGDGGTLPTIQSSVSAPALVTAAEAEAAAAANKETADATKKNTPVVPADVIHYIDPQILSAAIALTAQMPEGASLIYDPVSGMGFTDPRGWKAYFGVDFSNLSFKQAEYETIVDRLKKLGITPTMISVAFSDAPYYAE